ncbi:MAG: hypothetical protein ACOC21_01680 [Halanaerobiales bacterium]
MRMKRSVYQMAREKHKKLMKKLIEDDMNFNEFLDRSVNMFLSDKYELKEEKGNE